MVHTAKTYNVVAAIVFILLLGVFSYMGVFDWLPALIISVGVSICLRQLLQGCHLDVMVILILFGCLFFFSFTQFFARLFLPTFLIIGAFYYLLRQFYDFKKDKSHDKNPPVAPKS